MMIQNQQKPISGIYAVKSDDDPKTNNLLIQENRLSNIFPERLKRNVRILKSQQKVGNKKNAGFHRL